MRYLITVIEDERKSQVPVKSKEFGFERSQEVLKNFACSLSDAVIEERKLEH